jgi:hypothetical protein
VSKSGYKLTHATILYLENHPTKMKSQQMMELLLAMREDMRAWIKQMDAWLTDTNYTQEKTKACQEKTEARPEGKEEPTSVDM